MTLPDSPPPGQGDTPPDDDLTDDGFLGGALQILQPRRGYRAATDPVMLAAAMPAREGEEVLELGCGAGVASLCLAHRTGARPTGVELQPAYAALARRNAARNGIAMEVLTADLARLPPEARRSFDHVMMNPPFFATGDGTPAADPGRETANREDLPLATWTDAATRRLRPGGWLGVVHLAERLPDLLRALDGRIGTVSVLPLAGRAGRPAGRILLLGRKGGRGAFRLLAPLVMHQGADHEDGGGAFSPEALRILRGGEPLTAFRSN